jgi:hypothetical protein
MNGSLNRAAVLATLAVAIGSGPLLMEAAAQEVHPVPERIDNPHWIRVDADPLPNSFIAVVVWDDPNVEPALYDELSSELETYVQDACASGAVLKVFRFYGMAADPRGAANDLRYYLRELYSEHAIQGAILVGNVPHLLFERNTAAGHIDYPADNLIADLDATISDAQSEAPFRAGVFDTYLQGSQAGTEIWTARIMARPELVSYLGQSEVDILKAYFGRNHEQRSQVLGEFGQGLLYGCEACCPAALDGLGEVYQEWTVGEICPGAGYPSASDYVGVQLAYGYEHVHVHGCVGAVTTQFDSAVDRDDYVDVDSQTLSFVFDMSSNCDFAYADDASIGEVAAFNPEAAALLVLGAYNEVDESCTSVYYEALAQNKPGLFTIPVLVA